MKMTKKVLAIDGEASGATRNKGHPFDPGNTLVALGMFNEASGYHGDFIDRGGNPYGDTLYPYVKAVKESTLLVGFNIKYDLHWLRRYGIILSPNQEVWDCQIAHFLLTNQREVYPSLNDAAKRYDFAPKADIVKNEYWDKGIDTDQIPDQILLDYMQQDVLLTYHVYQKQIDEIEKAGLSKLMWLCCKDLLVLEEMEWNGMKYNKDLSLSKAKDLRVEESELLSQLRDITKKDFINWESPMQISAVLYGGKITQSWKTPVGQYKSGKRTGELRYQWSEQEHDFPRLIDPLPDTQLKKDNQFKTDEPTLSQLQAKGEAKTIIELVLRLSRIQKLIGTYYEGLVKKFEEYGWEDNIIHHQLNQSVAITGRLSSSNPNLQNADREIKECFVSRYGN